MSTISPSIAATPVNPIPTEADLAQAIRTLQYVAVQAITRLIGTETDPRELRRLLTIAPRYRIPDPPHQPSPPRPPAESRSRTGKPTAGATAPSSPVNPRGQADPHTPQGDPPDNDALEYDEADDDLSDDSTSLIQFPPLLPMTDEQYFALVKDIGITEATRRRAITPP